jgi:hypothetical protein
MAFLLLLNKVAASAAGRASNVSNLAAARLLGYASAPIMPHRAQIMRGPKSAPAHRHGLARMMAR